MKNDVLRRSCFVILLACGCSSTESSAPADPKAPSNLRAVPQGGGAHLTWNDNSSDEEVFEIERNDDATGSSQTIASVPFDTEVYHDADVVLGQRYTYRLRAKLPSSFTSYSNVATVTVTLTDEGAGGSTGSGGSTGTVGGSGSGASGMGSGAAGGQQGEAGNVGAGGAVDPGEPVSRICSSSSTVTPSARLVLCRSPGVLSPAYLSTTPHPFVPSFSPNSSSPGSRWSSRSTANGGPTIRRSW